MPKADYDAKLIAIQDYKQFFPSYMEQTASKTPYYFTCGLRIIMELYKEPINTTRVNWMRNLTKQINYSQHHIKRTLLALEDDKIIKRTPESIQLHPSDALMKKGIYEKDKRQAVMLYKKALRHAKENTDDFKIKLMYIQQLVKGGKKK